MDSAEVLKCSRERNALLLAHKPLVKRVAMRLRSRLPANVDMDDLVQAGMLGLNQAFTRYDDEHGASFDTYAARRIQGAMLDSLRDTDALPRSTRKRMREAQAAVQRLEHRLGRAPRAKEVANELGWTLEEFHDRMVEAGAGGSRGGDQQLDFLAHESSALDASCEQHAAIDEHADPQRGLQQRQRHAAVNAAFDALEERERYVIESIFKRQASLREIGDTLGLSPGRVSQMSSEIVAKLKRRLQDW